MGRNASAALPRCACIPAPRVGSLRFRAVKKYFTRSDHLLGSSRDLANDRSLEPLQQPDQLLDPLADLLALLLERLHLGGEGVRLLRLRIRSPGLLGVT